MATSETNVCQICDEEYNTGVKKPLVLACGHHFCTNCLLVEEVDECKCCQVCQVSWEGTNVADLQSYVPPVQPPAPVPTLVQHTPHNVFTMHGTAHISTLSIGYNPIRNVYVCDGVEGSALTEGWRAGAHMASNMAFHKDHRGQIDPDDEEDWGNNDDGQRRCVFIGKTEGERKVEENVGEIAWRVQWDGSPVSLAAFHVVLRHTLYRSGSVAWKVLVNGEVHHGSTDGELRVCNLHHLPTTSAAAALAGEDNNTLEVRAVVKGGTERDGYRLAQLFRTADNCTTSLPFKIDLKFRHKKGPNTDCPAPKTDASLQQFSSNHAFKFHYRQHVSTLCIKYNPVRNVYNCDGVDGDAVRGGWMAGVYSATNVAFKKETDHSMVYLARRDGAAGACRGEVVWRVQWNGDRVCLAAFHVVLRHTLFKSATIRWGVTTGGVLHRGDTDGELRVGNLHKPRSDLPTELDAPATTDNSNNDTLELRAELEGGDGDVAYQHAQLFRLADNDVTTVPFMIKLEFHHQTAANEGVDGPSEA